MGSWSLLDLGLIIAYYLFISLMFLKRLENYFFPLFLVDFCRRVGSNGLALYYWKWRKMKFETLLNRLFFIISRYKKNPLNW